MFGVSSIKEWHIKVENKIEGPYSVKNLLYDKRVTPDTWACKRGTSLWRRAKEIKELEILFKDKEEEGVEEEEVEYYPDEILVDRARKVPPYIDWLVLIALMLLLWLIFIVFK